MPTILIYGHYDVQPVDPVQQWLTGPFDPAVRDNDLYARGASDDKGQLFIHLKAIEAYLKTSGKLPVNVKLLLEGEEEIGSPNLGRFLERNRLALAADAAVISDTRMLGPDRPAITYGLRGQLGLQLTVRGADHDLHSGNFGGAAPDPLEALGKIIARLRDSRGRITLPHFYADVWPVDPPERRDLARSGPRDRRLLAQAQVRQAGTGERGFSLFERTTIRPALSVNGLTGGYQGIGHKAVIASQATAKLSFRLVPAQEPHEIARRFREHLARITPPGVRATVKTTAAVNPALINRNHPAIGAAADACRRVFGAPPAFIRSGGSLPAVDLFRQHLGLTTVLLGFALPDDHIHAPNERLHVPTWYKGIDTAIHFLARLAERPSVGFRPWHGRENPGSQGTVPARRRRR
jgi:acetylornithine deacetylase/succinyl-diaminopimelate desuccinylase-like protein